ncbi:hypothetical protein C4588_07255 [Candidatus Parcubacteria bacterium]|nr:MAG: hypothetical protein C4588_07255 [Candidatus Parcubacteria bacterium]
MSGTQYAAPRQGETVVVGKTAIVPKRAAFTAATGADRTIVAAVTDKKIRVLSIVGGNGTAGTVTFKSTSGSLSGAIPIPGNGLLVLIPSDPVGYLETPESEALLVNASAGSFNGFINYIEI